MREPLLYAKAGFFSDIAQAVLDYIWPLFAKLFTFLRDMVVTVWTVIKTFVLDFLFALYDGFLSLFESLIMSIPVPASWSTSNPLDSLPAQTLYVLYEIGLLQALAIILSAWLIRWVINLIPAAFTRV